MKKYTLTIQKSIFIRASTAAVWDFTQDYSNRTKWDAAVLQAEVLQRSPNRIVKLKLRGSTTLTFYYKLDDRPNKTTLVAKEITSSFILESGGSWKYENKDGGTLWTQTNTIAFKNSLLLPLLFPLYQWMLKRGIRRAMEKAKMFIEQR